MECFSTEMYAESVSVYAASVSALLRLSKHQ